MSTKLSSAVILALIIISLAASILMYSKLPQLIPTHWNFQGQIDGYGPKSVALFIMPIVALVMFLFFWLIPKIDPLKENIKQFRGYFNNFIVLIIAFLFYIYLLTIFTSLNYQLDFFRFFAPAIGVLIFYAGVLIKHAKRNWFIGIRTPWTISNDIVWDKTHKIGSWLFKISGVLCFLVFAFPNPWLFVFALPVWLLVSTAYLVVYSYFEYKKISR